MDGLPHSLYDDAHEVKEALNQRRLEEMQAAAANPSEYMAWRDREKETCETVEPLYGLVRCEQIAEPQIAARPGWAKHLERRSRELAAQRFTPFFHYHYASATDAGLPNFTAVFLSADRTVAASLYYAARRRNRHFMRMLPTLDPVQESRCLTLTTAYEDVRWAFSQEYRFRLVNYPPEFAVNYLPEEVTIQEATQSHTRFVWSDALKDGYPIRWESPAQYLEWWAREREHLVAGIHDDWKYMHDSINRSVHKRVEESRPQNDTHWKKIRGILDEIRSKWEPIKPPPPPPTDLQPPEPPPETDSQGPPGQDHDPEPPRAID